MCSSVRVLHRHHYLRWLHCKNRSKCHTLSACLQVFKVLLIYIHVCQLDHILYVLAELWERNSAGAALATMVEDSGHLLKTTSTNPSALQHKCQ